MYKKSTKLYLILLHFAINVHIDGLNKYVWIKEAN